MGYCCSKPWGAKKSKCPASAVDSIPDGTRYSGYHTCVIRKQGNKTQDRINIERKNSVSCKLEIWSGDDFNGDHAECTGNCDIDKLGSVGNDKARSARCSCYQSREFFKCFKTQIKRKRNTFFKDTSSPRIFSKITESLNHDLRPKYQKVQKVQIGAKVT